MRQTLALEYHQAPALLWTQWVRRVSEHINSLMLQDGQFSSYVWRRGSVPLRWTQTVKSNGVGTAIAIEAEQTFRGSRKCDCLCSL